MNKRNTIFYMIGIIADTHDNMEAINNAVNIFNQNNVDMVLHAGDLVAPFTVNEFSRLENKFVAVFGNNDGEREGLRKAYQDLCFIEDFKEIEIADKKFAIIHGTNELLVDALSKSGKYDVIIRGHTHKLDIKEGKTLVINPGEACGYVTGDKTLVLLEPQTLKHQVVKL
ncbi:MAG: metallophosphoesterase [Methanobacteriaceae archaeon]|nr:metallophosphoesterase [Methanobacteriaceae archaeon]